MAGVCAGRVDDEVGAFVRLIQEARPLDSSTTFASSAGLDSAAPSGAAAAARWSPSVSALGSERSLQASLDQLKAFKASLLPPPSTASVPGPAAGI